MVSCSASTDADTLIKSRCRLREILLEKTLLQIDEMQGRVLELEKGLLALEKAEVAAREEYLRLREMAALIRSPVSPRSPGYVPERIDRLRAILLKKADLLEETIRQTGLLFHQTDHLKKPVYREIEFPFRSGAARKPKSAEEDRIIIYSLGETQFAVRGLPYKTYRHKKGRSIRTRSEDSEIVYFPEKPELFTGRPDAEMKLLVYRVLENAYLALWCESVVKIRSDIPGIESRVMQSDRPNRWIQGRIRLEGENIYLIKTKLTVK